MRSFTSETFSRILQRLSDKRPQFLAFLRKRVESAAVAEDLLQAAYLRAIEHVDELRDGQRAEAWFYRLLRNLVIDHYRRPVASPVASIELDELPGETHSQQPNTCPCAVRELTRLRNEYSQALETIEMQDMPVQDFARRERITPGNASVRLHRARKALARRIVAVCGPCAGAGCFDCQCASALSTLPTFASQV
jgi:RNA polymerase sigma factor (sigma-70 family)